MQYINSAGAFLINTVFSFLVFIVLLRFLLQWTRADFYNPFSQFIVKVSNPVLKPLRRIIPGLWGLDIASLLLALALQFIALYLLLSLSIGTGAHPLGVLLMAIAELLNSIIWIFIVSILIEVVMSWVNPHSPNPILRLAVSLSAPLMRPARNILPPMGGIDFSPILVLIALQLMLILLVRPLSDAGQSMLL